jgi:glycerol kinase
VLEAMAADWGVRIEALHVDGGMTANNLLLELQAGLLDLPVVRAAVAETTALGAAQAAGLAVGLHASLEDLAATWRDSGTFSARLEPAERARWIAGWERAVERSLNLA